MGPPPSCFPVEHGVADPGIGSTVEEEEDGAEEGIGETGKREEAEAPLVLGHGAQHEGGKHQRQDEQQTPATKSVLKVET